ncbi:hypothetical protein RJ639_010277 [Escallonia herrerae]|uniref:Protein LIKE COV 2-like n=1 Tax=Escallonia herrerae TaxID=1293975 RepID=A0AA88VST5_9ASTE|nr:hypothetical protein RJ639_010277 [Escallonia herrerae]
MAEEKESTSVPLSQCHEEEEEEEEDPEDPVESPPNSPNSSTRKACCFVLQSWVSQKFMTGCVVLFPVLVTFFLTWWFIEFVDGFFSPLYARLGIDIFGLGFVTSLLFVLFIGIFVSSWMGASVFLVGEWIIKRMPFIRHIYSASKQISAAISPDQNTTAFKEVAIIRHPRVGEYAFGFITSSVNIQIDDVDEELCSVFVPTNHLYIGDTFLVSSKDIIRPNLSIREGIGQRNHCEASRDVDVESSLSSSARVAVDLGFDFGLCTWSRLVGHIASVCAMAAIEGSVSTKTLEKRVRDKQGLSLNEAQVFVC